ncbi:MAG: hypothetical protein HOV80_22540 [Polyangiaceae bacterium]|nr:hypothetical protein [Polyangiaceae bacterium]
MCPPKISADPPSGLKDRLLGRSEEWLEVEAPSPPPSERAERSPQSCEPKSLRDLLARLVHRVA